MLKALELIGFKSFADRTRFEFPRGITVVVGPNGSGKSNVVDAIKWVLGEQSVKSLRGKEMVDVIFNGSSARRALNSAETTLTFDNSDRRLAIDTPDVHVTRRVYRSGEAEYLINRQPCRLRDIRDLFAGTGIATEAYSIIEQGKVDVMLQASAKDRRMIFEEAAGISRFKAKKIEALRRLERVDQNLLRLKDIVDEVESRLKSVRAQANKARRYKEYADRLQQLRTHVGFADWRGLSERLAKIEGEIQELRTEKTSETESAEGSEKQAAELEGQRATIDQDIRTAENELAEARQRTAGIDATLEQERARIHDLDELAAGHRKQIQALSNRAADLGELWRSTQAEVEAAEAAHRQAAGVLADHERALTALTTQLDQIRTENEERRQSHLEQLRTSAALANEISTLEARLSRTDENRQRCEKRREELASAQEAGKREVDLLSQRQQELADRVAGCGEEWSAIRDNLAQARRQLAERQKELAGWRERASGATERAAVLEELERRREGVAPGAQEVLRFANENREGPFQQVRGLLADLVRVSIDTAPMIEAALGEKAQFVVVAPGSRLLDYLAAHGKRLSGRVGFLPMDVSGPTAPAVDLASEIGVIGRADRFVEASHELAALVHHLLGIVWMVESLRHALALADGPGRGLTFVTLACDVMTADRTVIVGQRQAVAGLISRRSELAALRAQITDLQQKIGESARVVEALEQQVAEQERLASEAADAHHAASEALAEGRLRANAATSRSQQLAEQHAALESELRGAAEQCRSIVETVAGARTRLDQIQSVLAQSEARMSDNARRMEELDQARGKRTRDCLSAQVGLARTQQQLEHLRGQLSRYEQDRQERERTIAEANAQLAECLSRSEQADERILAGEMELAELFLTQERVTSLCKEMIEQRDRLETQRSGALQAAQANRVRIHKLEENLHEQELVATQVRHERTTLESRLREDYGIELSELTHEPTEADQHQRETIEAEIADLRRKLTNIGGVNLDALAEVEELETRFASLSTQHQDLSAAKDSLEKIIHKINADSRRLFSETLQTVRGHFQQLFRKLFGGGQADIVLDEDVDVLESGIEIVARPPGKEPRNISLLSGGEKTLTCVALLLAIFRSRPSPFCVLDEVDAALDEANIERFINVLHEFLQWTQFVVVTHSKKTMAFANTLYGVTMQESGVSKRVSVRFDDVSEDGEISRAALEREAQATVAIADEPSDESATEAA
jgi:chromosome segregation protein